MNPDELTLGIEEEYQIIDPRSRELTSYVSEFLKKGGTVFRDQVKPEFLQSQIEIASFVCRNITKARQEVRRLRRMVCEIFNISRHRIVAAGTHPFRDGSNRTLLKRTDTGALLRTLSTSRDGCLSLARIFM